MRNQGLIRRAEGIDRFVVAPVRVEAIVLLDAFENVFAHFVSPGAILAFEEKTLASIGRAFAEHRTGGTQSGQHQANQANYNSLVHSPPLELMARACITGTAEIGRASCRERV